MDIETLRQWVAQRDTYSILETVDVHTGERTVLQEFDTVIEAPIGPATAVISSTTAAGACSAMN